MDVICWLTGSESEAFKGQSVEKSNQFMDFQDDDNGHNNHDDNNDDNNDNHLKEGNEMPRALLGQTLSTLFSIAA